MNEGTPGWLQGLWQRLKGQIVQAVPEDAGLCEFDCRKLQCTEEEWLACERRIRNAGGELWPGLDPMVQKETKSSIITVSENLDVKLQFRCSKELEKALQIRAKQEGRSLSYLIPVLLESALAGKKA